jgi:hypothetical protein
VRAAPDRVSTVTEGVRRAASWIVLVSASLSTAVVMFWVVAFVDGLRHAIGYRLERPMLLLLGTLTTSVGVVGSGVAARAAWRWPGRSQPMIVAASLGLTATCVGGSLVVRSYELHVMPHVSENVLDDGRSADPRTLPGRRADAGMRHGVSHHTGRTRTSPAGSVAHQFTYRR